MVAILTGASGDIGNSILKTLLNRNYKIYALYNNNKIQLEDKNIIPVKINLENLEEINDFFKKIENEKIELLINNAGISMIKQIQDTSNNDLIKIVNINLLSSYIFCREVSKIMIRNKKGQIINISSIWRIVGSSMESAYSMTKARLDGLTKSLSKELGPSNIRVNSISPGLIDTKMNKFLLENEEELKTVIDEIPICRIGKVEDISNCVEFLMDNSYITGQIIQINGGWQ